VSNIFDNAIDKGRMAQEWCNWNHHLCRGESYCYIAGNDIRRISNHIDRLESIIDELLLQLDQERDRRS
jgi:hypothetical protein